MSTPARSKNMDLTQGPVMKQLFLYTYPLFIGLLIQQLYGAADQVVVGRFAGKLPLAAIGVTSYPLTLLLGLVAGFSTGANVVISNFRGSRDAVSARKASHTAILLSLICGFGIMVVGLCLTDPILRWMETPEDTYQMAKTYMSIRFIGTPLALLYNFGAAILRAHGDTKRPTTILTVSGFVNLLMNVVFVVGFHRNVDGVAWATVISQLVSSVMVLWILMSPKEEYNLKLREIKLHKGFSPTIIRIGLPMGISSSLMSLSGIFLQASINSFGSIVMAGSTAAGTVTNIASVAVSSFFHSTVSFAGQCYGAKRYQRLKQLQIYGSILCAGVVAFMAVLCTIFPRFLLSLFNTDPAVIDAGVPKLLHIAWGYVFQGVAQISLGISRGMKKSYGPTCISLFTLCIVRILWIKFVFPFYPDSLHMLYFCLPLSMICNAIGHNIYATICQRKLKKEAALQ